MGSKKEREGRTESCIWQITIVTHACKASEGAILLSSPAFLGRTMWLLGDGQLAGDSVLKHHTSTRILVACSPPSDSDIPAAAHCTATARG